MGEGWRLKDQTVRVPIIPFRASLTAASPMVTRKSTRVGCWWQTRNEMGRIRQSVAGMLARTGR